MWSNSALRVLIIFTTSPFPFLPGEGSRRPPHHHVSAFAVLPSARKIKIITLGGINSSRCGRWSRRKRPFESGSAFSGGARAGGSDVGKRETIAGAWSMSIRDTTQQVDVDMDMDKLKDSSSTTNINSRVDGYNPDRDVGSQAYQSTEGWTLKYHDIKTRRDAAEARAKRYTGPPMRIIIAGKPSSGKGSISPMLSRAFRGVYIASGNLLRSEAQAETELGKVADESMSKGEMLPCDVILSLVTKRLEQRDCLQNGWIVDGFPRSREQAIALSEHGIAPDLIVMLERPDELVREFSLGRCTDSTTGVIYHPKFSPPPREVQHRLTWRTDDTLEVINKRLRQYKETADGIMDAYKGVPYKVVDSSLSDLETFDEICDFVEEVAAKKAEALGPDGVRALREMGDDRMSDVQELTDEERRAFEARPTLLAAAQRCNHYVADDYIPVFVAGVKVGAVSKSFARELGLFTASTVELRPDMPGAGPFGQEGPGYVLAPYASSVDERSRIMKGLVEGLADIGAISKQALRNELQDVRALTGKLSVTGTPLFRLERAAMIYFGIPSFGVHLNGYVKGDGKEPMRIWIGVRSVSKATYPGLWDQMVAGGQPAGTGFRANLVKECEEEGSLPASLTRQIKAVGQVSYRYGTRKGLSTKFLCVFDLELPEDFTPYNGDGEVDQFLLMPVEEALDSIKTDLAQWKPNCALVMIDFALRHAFLDPDHEARHSLKLTSIRGIEIKK
ncbi:unnamed protein product [Ascophyllum nodosum]